jgi:hypothetical protein
MTKPSGDRHLTQLVHVIGRIMNPSPAGSVTKE